MSLLLIQTMCIVFSIAFGLSHFHLNNILFEDKDGKIYYENVTDKTFKKLSPEDVRLFLYTRNNAEHGCEIQKMTINELQNCNFYNSTKENYFIIHGWKNSYKTESSVVIKEAVLEKANFNVFVIDWGNIAKHSYFTSQSAVQLVGEVVATFINDMVVSLKVPPKMFMLVGHSLGAHIAGCTGRALKGSIRYIVGLDPAGPLFTLSNKDNRLDMGDAKFVQVIHTSTTFLGFAESIGHADYYPNGGNNQLGCSTDVFGGCSHARSYMYFVESILRGGFMAQACENYKQLKNGQCANVAKSYLGRIELDTKASGNYYLHINKNAPFSLN